MPKSKLQNYLTSQPQTVYSKNNKVKNSSFLEGKKIVEYQENNGKTIGDMGHFQLQYSSFENQNKFVNATQQNSPRFSEILQQSNNKRLKSNQSQKSKKSQKSSATKSKKKKKKTKKHSRQVSNQIEPGSSTLNNPLILSDEDMEQRAEEYREQLLNPYSYGTNHKQSQ